MNIIRLSIPTPFYVGDVNVYLVKADPVTLIDVGPKTDAAEAELRRQLRENGLEFSDIKRIVLTHAHEDHCGLSKVIRDESQAVVMLHPWESSHLNGRLSHESNRRLLTKSGVPMTVFDEMRAVYEEVSLLTDSFADHDIVPLENDAELEFARGSLRVVHTPGHTPGSCSFFREADRTLICGDCVLKRITPNPILAPDPLNAEFRFRSLGEYLVSLAKLRELRPTVVHGGHGDSIADFDEIFNRYVRGIDDRQKDVISLLEPVGSTAFDVARRLFPGAVGKTVHQFLAISESIAHLDYAESEGKIDLELKDGVEVYRKK